MSRTILSTVTLICGALLTTGIALAEGSNPNLTGSWQMDSAKSHVADGRIMTLSIVHKTDNIKVEGFVVDKTGAKTDIHFDCKADGSNCDFMEGTHKSKMSVWSAAGTVTACKTEGPSGDAVTEWHMKLTPDKNLLIDVEHVDPAEAAETIVLTKKN